MEIERILQAGRFIRQRLADLQMNQHDIAHKTGISQSIVSKYTRGATTSPHFEPLVRLGSALGMSPNDIAELYGVWYAPEAPSDRRLQNLMERVTRLNDLDRHQVTTWLSNAIDIYEAHERREAAGQ